MPPAELIAYSLEIAETKTMYEFMRSGISAELAERLMCFENPLEVARDVYGSGSNLPPNEELYRVLEYVLNDPDAKRGYELDGEFTAEPSEPAQDFIMD
jgi:hypothetical protein